MKREPKPKPVCQAARTWLQVRLGKQCLAPLTGGTSRAFSAYLHLVEAWMSSRSPHIVEALRHTALALQRKEWPLAAEAIAHVGDWSHIEELWSQIRPPGAPMFAYHATTDTVLGFYEKGCAECGGEGDSGHRAFCNAVGRTH